VVSVHRLADVKQTPAERERVAAERDRLADERDRIADERDRRADQRERVADERDRRAGTAAEVQGRPTPTEVDPDLFGINLGLPSERPQTVDSDEHSPQPSPRTLTERLAAAAVDRDDSDTPTEGLRSPED
jgi:hypothetical protein